MLGPRRYETKMGNGSRLCLQVERGPRPGKEDSDVVLVNGLIRSPYQRFGGSARLTSKLARKLQPAPQRTLSSLPSPSSERGPDLCCGLPPFSCHSTVSRHGPGAGSSSPILVCSESVTAHVRLAALPFCMEAVRLAGPPSRHRLSRLSSSAYGSCFNTLCSESSHSEGFFVLPQVYL